MKKIFIIDNLNSIIDFYTDFLTLKGYKITGAITASDCFKRLNRFNPDLIIFDTDMPDRESREFLRLISISPVRFTTPILFLTGFISESKLKYYENIGNCSFLSKESSNIQILSRIKRLVDGYKIELPSHNRVYRTKRVDRTNVINN